MDYTIYQYIEPPWHLWDEAYLFTVADLFNIFLDLR